MASMKTMRERFSSLLESYISYRLNMNNQIVRELKTRKISVLGIELTHRCNMNCPLCDHRISTSKYGYLKKSDYYKIVEYFQEYNIDTLELLGGEPTLHPHFRWLIRNMRKDLAVKRLHVITNGILLPNFSKSDLQQFDLIRVSHYPGHNDQVAESNLSNLEFLEVNEMWNPYVDPQLDEKTAREVYKLCGSKKMRVIGDRIYGCCLAEGIERYFKTEPIHAKLTATWSKDYVRLKTHKACRHCFRALDYIDQIGISNSRTGLLGRQWIGPIARRLKPLAKVVINEFKATRR